MTKRDQYVPSTSTQNFSNDANWTNNQYIAKLRDGVVKKIVRENLVTSSLAYDHDQLTRLVEQRIMKMISNFHTPDHPTYAFMIRRAITELIDEGRTDKESISEFIRKEYDDLPVAHESVLMFQLNKLCEKREILLSAVGCYLLPVADSVQQKILKKENGENGVEKKGNGGGEFLIRDGKFKRNGTVDGTREGEVCLRQMNDMQCKGSEGLRKGTRWSRRLQSFRLQVDEANKDGRGVVEDISKRSRTEGENGTSRDQKGHKELPTADHRQDQQIEIFEGEPYGFLNKSEQLILQKQAFEIGAEVEIGHEENNEMKSDTLQHYDDGNISGFGEHDLFKPSCKEKEPMQLRTELNAISEDEQKIQFQIPASELDNDSLRSKDMDVDLHGDRNAGIADVVLFPGERGKAAANDCVLILNQTTDVELSPLREEEAEGSSQCQGLGTCTDNVPKQLVPNATLGKALGDHQTLRTEVVTTLRNLTTDASPAALLNSQPDDDQHIKKQGTPMRRGRGRPRKTSYGFPIITEKPNKKDGRGRPRTGKPDNLPEPTANIEVESTSIKTADSWDGEVADTKNLQQNSNSVNVWILALKAASQDKDGTTNKRKKTASETMDFREAKKGRGKGNKKNCYTDVTITDLIYSQDHLLQPMTRFRGRPRKL